eukprot:2756020-Amphidinium_carterae.1
MACSGCLLYSSWRRPACCSFAKARSPGCFTQTVRLSQPILASVAIHPPTNRRLYCTAAVPLSVVQTWIPKKQMIGQIELFGAVLGLLTFRQEMAECDVIHFVDNDSATASLIRGSSNKSDSAKLVGLYWILAAVHRMNIFIDRVESKSNPADGPSRADCAALEMRGFLRRDVQLEFFNFDPSLSPADWFTQQAS